MSTAVHHCPYSTRFAWVIFFCLSAPYLPHDFPWSIPSFSSTQIHFLWTAFSFSYRIPSSLPSISSSQFTWVHVLYWRKNPSDLVAAELKEIARNVLLLSHSFRQDLALCSKNYWVSSSLKFLLAHKNSYNAAIFKIFVLKSEQTSLNFQSCALNHSGGTSPC